MKTLFVILSIALIFAGIAGVLYVDSKQQKEKTKKESVSISNSRNSLVNDEFAAKRSMKEIDSITSAYNYHFTVDNAVAAKTDSSNKSISTKKI